MNRSQTNRLLGYPADARMLIINADDFGMCHAINDDYDLLDSFRLDIVDKSARYAQLLRELPIGLSEWAVHPGLDTAELLAIQPDGSQVRQTDFDFLMSQEAQDVVHEEGIILMDYRALQAVWKAK